MRRARTGTSPGLPKVLAGFSPGLRRVGKVARGPEPEGTRGSGRHGSARNFGAWTPRRQETLAPGMKTTRNFGAAELGCQKTLILGHRDVTKLWRPGARTSRNFGAQIPGRQRNWTPGVDSSCPLCYHLLQRRERRGGPGAAKTKPHSRKPEPDSNGLATLDGPTGSSPGSDACGDPSGGGTGIARSTSHGSMKQEAAGRLFHPRRVK